MRGNVYELGVEENKNVAFFLLPMLLLPEFLVNRKMEWMMVKTPFEPLLLVPLHACCYTCEPVVLVPQTHC